ncbi:MAG: hypothetical protein HAW62_04300 [Endozoicomonadaceae bacterium]|nr:hypothetical protein [Endozoicomonadaceae bacterium]
MYQRYLRYQYALIVIFFLNVWIHTVSAMTSEDSEFILLALLNKRAEILYDKKSTAYFQDLQSQSVIPKQTCLQCDPALQETCSQCDPALETSCLIKILKDDDFSHLCELISYDFQDNQFEVMIKKHFDLFSKFIKSLQDQAFIVHTPKQTLELQKSIIHPPIVKSVYDAYQTQIKPFYSLFSSFSTLYHKKIDIQCFIITLDSFVKDCQDHFYFIEYLTLQIFYNLHLERKVTQIGTEKQVHNGLMQHYASAVISFLGNKTEVIPMLVYDYLYALKILYKQCLRASYAQLICFDILKDFVKCEYLNLQNTSEIYALLDNAYEELKKNHSIEGLLQKKQKGKAPCMKRQFAFRSDPF